MRTYGSDSGRALYLSVPPFAYLLFLSSPAVLLLLQLPHFLRLSSQRCHVGCCSRAYSTCVWVAVVLAAGHSPVDSPALHIKQAALQGLSSSLDRTCQFLGGASESFQKHSPGRLPLSLSLSLLIHSLPFLIIPIQHTLSQSH